MKSRKRITKDLTVLLERYINPNKDTRIYTAKEVTFDYATGHAVRVDYMRFKPINNSVSGIEKGDFYCYEIKSSVEDFHSKNGHNFIGDYNYYVMPEDVYEKVKEEIPWNIGVFVSSMNKHNGFMELAQVKKARRLDRERPVRNEYKRIDNIPEFVPVESLEQLTKDGVWLFSKHHKDLNYYIIELNRNISERINNCKYLFPNWVKWDYIKDIFVIPNGFTESGVKKAVDVYYANMDSYPYKMFINWKPRSSGNVLYNDKKFLTLLYDMNDDIFTDMNRVSDVGAYTKEGIYQFLNNSDNVAMIVDCENSDPYRLCAVLQGLPKDKIGKIRKIILVDDINTCKAWKVLKYYTSIPVEHVMTERVIERKSLVDIELSVRTCMEFFKNQVDSFIIASSDSDYWGLVNSLKEAHFIFMVERENFGVDMKNMLIDHNIFYCYIEDFYAEDMNDIKMKALYHEMCKILSVQVAFNINDIVDMVLESIQIDLLDSERDKFMKEHPMNLNVDEAGNVTIGLI